MDSVTEKYIFISFIELDFSCLIYYLFIVALKHILIFITN